MPNQNHVIYLDYLVDNVLIEAHFQLLVFIGYLDEKMFIVYLRGTDVREKITSYSNKERNIKG